MKQTDTKQANWKESLTYRNLTQAFGMEAVASMKYHYFSTTARREKMVYICELFEACEKYELEHAKMWYKDLYEGDGSTGANLADAVTFEEREAEVLYPRFAAEARSEGYEEIAEQFEAVGRVSAENRARFAKWHKALENGSVFVSKTSERWQCSTCGTVLFGMKAPEVCPTCGHGKAYYRIIFE